MATRKKVLVVEDDDLTRAFFATTLKLAGYEVTATGSLTEAKTLLKRMELDALVADVRLGNFNGLQLVVTKPELPALVLTGYPDPFLAAEARHLGATFVLKPISRYALVQLVKRLLRH